MYEPNLQDPRVRRRLRTAFAFVVAWLSAGGKPIGKQQIDQAVGHSGNPLSQWIRAELLVCTDDRWNKDTGQTKRWAYNTSGVHWLAQQLGYPEFHYNPQSQISADRQLCLFYRSYAIEYLQQQFGQQLATGEFHYRDSSNRLWSPLQNLRREVRTQLLAQAGMQYQYDIQSCAPTLLYQLYLKNNHYLPGLVEMPHIQQLLSDRTSVREQLSVATGVGVDQIKTTLTAMFCGARLTPHGSCALYRELDKNTPLMQALNNNTWILNYRREVRLMWTGIQRSLNIPQMDNSTKWQIYFRLERQVMDHLDTHMKQSGARTFRIHDCLATDQEFQQTDLETSVETATGYQIIIERKHHSLATQV
jgi:hypothetical protein